MRHTVGVTIELDCFTRNGGGRDISITGEKHIKHGSILQVECALQHVTSHCKFFLGYQVKGGDVHNGKLD